MNENYYDIIPVYWPKNKKAIKEPYGWNDDSVSYEKLKKRLTKKPKQFIKDIIRIRSTNQLACLDIDSSTSTKEQLEILAALQGIDRAIEKSQSGNGYHVFFRVSDKQNLNKCYAKTPDGGEKYNLKGLTKGELIYLTRNWIEIKSKRDKRKQHQTQVGTLKPIDTLKPVEASVLNAVLGVFNRVGLLLKNTDPVLSYVDKIEKNKVDIFGSRDIWLSFLFGCCDPNATEDEAYRKEIYLRVSKFWSGINSSELTLEEEWLKGQKEWKPGGNRFGTAIKMLKNATEDLVSINEAGLFVDWDALPMRPVIGDIVKEAHSPTKGFVTLIAGDTGSGKSALVMFFCESLATKGYVDIGGRKPFNPSNSKKENLKILYIDVELSTSLVKARLGKKPAYDHMFNDNFIDTFGIDDDSMNNFKAYVKKERYDLLVIDNFGWFSTQYKIDPAKDSMGTIQLMVTLKSFGIPVIIVDHTRKEHPELTGKAKPLDRNEIAGSKNKINYADQVIMVGKIKNQTTLNEMNAHYNTSTGNKISTMQTRGLYFKYAKERFGNDINICYPFCTLGPVNDPNDNDSERKLGPIKIFADEPTNELNMLPEKNKK